MNLYKPKLLKTSIIIFNFLNLNQSLGWQCFKTEKFPFFSEKCFMFCSLVFKFLKVVNRHFKLYLYKSKALTSPLILKAFMFLITNSYLFIRIVFNISSP